jgi:CPA2 family monovalent cation:H+ antiporter-2
LSLLQVGEFSFVLAISGMAYGLISAEHHQLFLAVSIITMAATPAVMARLQRIAGGTFDHLLPRTGEALDSLLNVGTEVEGGEHQPLRGHLVMVGFGPNGQDAALAAQSVKVRCAVVEEDPELATLAMQRGLRTVQGDAAQATVLAKADVPTARTVVIALNDTRQTKRVLANMRSLTKATLIVRVRSASEEAELLALGADEVVAEDMEAGMRIVSGVLQRFQVPGGAVREITAHLRSLREKGKEPVGAA